MRKFCLLFALIYCRTIVFSQTIEILILNTFDSGYDQRKKELNPQADIKVDSILHYRTSLVYPSCYVPFSNTGQDGWLDMPRNDDQSLGPINLGWDFSLYGTLYNKVYLNTNGNITFLNGVSTYTPQGFPIATPMIAAFWADIDTRNTSGGTIWYKLFPDKLVITWDQVGYYQQRVDKLNGFLMIIKANTSPTFVGDDVVFGYENMQWTTGEASSGVSGFGGSPATVGANKGDGISYIQTGRFNINSSLPPNNNGNGSFGGVSWLNGKCLGYQVRGISGTNIAPAVAGLPLNNEFILNNQDDRNFELQFSGPETYQNVNLVYNFNGLCNITGNIINNNTSNPRLIINLLGASCNLGTHPITVTATDSGVPVSTQIFFFNIIINPCQSLVTLVSPNDDITTTGGIIQANQNNGKIIATNKILNIPSIVLYQAKSIELKEGFKTESGVVFKAETGGCN